MAQERIDQRTNLDKVFDSKTGRFQSSVTFGMADLHSKEKIEFADTDTSNSISIDPYADLEDSYQRIDEAIEFLNPNPDSFYIITVHNPSSEDATFKVFNQWEDADGNSRESELTSSGELILAGESDIIPVEGMFCGNSVTASVSIPSQEGSAWTFYLNIYRP